MDDLQFRRTILADPTYTDNDIIDAINIDKNKQDFVKEVDFLEQKIQNALQIDVPDGLAEKLIFRQTLASHQQNKRKNRIQLALAASIAFVFGLSFNFFQSSPAYTTIGDYALAHTHHEESMHHNNDIAQISLASMNEQAKQFGVSFNQQLGTVISSGICDFGGIKALHLVFKGENSPVTVFVINKDAQFSMEQSFSDNKLKGVAQQLKHADFIIVAEKDEPIDHWKQIVQKDISQSI